MIKRIPVPGSARELDLRINRKATWSDTNEMDPFACRKPFAMSAVDSIACYEEKLAYECLERLQQRRKGEPVLPTPERERGRNALDNVTGAFTKRTQQVLLFSKHLRAQCPVWFGERADLLERADADDEDAKRGIRVRAETANNVYTLRIYIRDGGWLMGTARIFRSGNSQAVRLPKQFRLKSKEVEIFRRGDEIVLREKDGTMVRAFDLLANLPDDLEFVGREKDQPQKRKGL